jgi:hypothetical protein
MKLAIVQSPRACRAFPGHVPGFAARSDSFARKKENL